MSTAQGDKQDSGPPAPRFDLAAVEAAVSLCLPPSGGDIPLDRYIDAYEQLVRFFDVLGSVFKFVTSDIVDKLGILRHHRRQPVTGAQYETVQSMVTYEVSKELTRARTSPLSGSRTLLRLHRALAFIVRLFNDIAAVTPEDKMSAVVWRAYDETLSKYHTWIIRKTVGLAMYAVPGRTTLVEKLQSGSEPEVIAAFQRIVAKVQPVYDTVQALYARYDILDLP